MSELTDDLYPGDENSVDALDREYHKPIVICDERDKEKWLEARRRLITSSDLMVFLGQQPHFWSFSSRQSVIEDKMGNDSYDPNNNTEHGSFNEECNRQKAEKLLGIDLPVFQKLVVNPRWPHLGATPDCRALPSPLAHPNKLFTSHPHLVDAVRESVALETTPGNCQLKSTDSPRAVQYGKRGYPQAPAEQDWITHPPEYHMVQVMAEAAIMGQSWILLIGQLGAHNIAPWFIPYDPTFDAVMDAAEADAKEVFRQIKEGEQVDL
jgi:hypothetical protein